MTEPTFDPTKPDPRFFYRIKPFITKNQGRRGRIWTAKEMDAVRFAAESGVSVQDCCEEMGRPFGPVASRYARCGVLFEDIHFQYWKRITPEEHEPL